MDLPDDIEIIFVDDGSEPPLHDDVGLPNFTMLYTNDKRPWTQPIARNKGVRHAKGEYVICTDIDHIITRDLITAVEEISTDVLRFKREFGVLDSEGNFTQDPAVLLHYGLPKHRVRKRGFRIRPHSNSYAICRELFLELGGSRERRIMFYPNRDEVPLKSMLKKMQAALSPGNVWAHSASLIIAVFSRKEDDCIIKSRLYYQFDTGMGVGFLLLRATELGLVAHPIAGFSPKKTREILGITDEYRVITLVIVGKHAKTLNPILSPEQKKSERSRPERKPTEEFIHLNRFQEK